MRLSRWLAGLIFFPTRNLTKVRSVVRYRLFGAKPPIEKGSAELRDQ